MLAVYAFLTGIPFVGPFIAGAVGVARTLARICNAIPGVVFAIPLVAMSLLYLWTESDLTKERHARAALQGQYTALTEAVMAQKKEAGRILELERAKTEKINADLRESRAKLEKASAQRIIDSKAAEKRLDAAAARNGGRLHDPNQTGCGSGGSGPQADPPAVAGVSAANPAEAGGLLSLPLSELLRRAMRESQEVNDAYADCRQDAINTRAPLAPSP